LNSKTDEIEKIRRALGDKHAATFDGIAQHTTRKQAERLPSMRGRRAPIWSLQSAAVLPSISPRSSSWPWSTISATKRGSILFRWVRA
jgi:hypothetical protein